MESTWRDEVRGSNSGTGRDDGQGKQQWEG